MKMPLKNKILMYFIITIIVILLPRAFTKTSETQAMAIVTALGIDMIEDEIEISAQIIVPKPQAGTSKGIMTVSSKNIDVSLALEDLSTYIGKNIGIEHCEAIVLGKKLSEEGLEDTLDYFFRGNKIDHNTLIIYFDGRAKDLIDATLQIEKNFSLSLDDITKFSEEYFTTLETTLEKFYSENYSSNKISIIGGLKLGEKEYGLALSPEQSGGSSGGSSSAESSGGGGGSQDSSGSESSSSSQESKPKFLIDEGKSAIYKDWKLVKVLDYKETIAMNWFRTQSKKYSLRIDNINDNLYDGASVVFSISNKRVAFSTDFVNDLPVLKAKIYIDLKIENILGGNKEKFKDVNADMFTPMLKSRVIGHILNDTDSIMNLLKSEKLDIIRIYDKFEKYHYKDLMKLIEEQGLEKFYENLITDVQVHITEKQ